MSSRRSCKWAGVLAVVALLAAPDEVVRAQGVPVGTPLADSKQPAGNLIVQVVNGTMSRPLSALDVSVVDEASGKELVVRTGPDGRAPFRGLAVGGRYTAFIKVGDKEIASAPITMPAEAGVIVLLSPTPLQAGAGDGDAAGGGGGAGPQGMPDPRQMSGVPRAEAGDPPGSLTVRTIQGKFRTDEIAGRVADIPKGALVHLVRLGVGSKITVESVPVDDEGRVQFQHLRTDNSEAYWVLSAFARGPTTDRLQSPSIELPPQVGLRLMLAGLAPDATEKGVDDLPALLAGQTTPAVGDVVVELGGQGDRVQTLELVNLITTATVSMTAATESQPGPVEARISDAEAVTALRDGLIQVRVNGPTGPLAGSRVKVSVAATGQTLEAITDAGGEVTIEGLKAGQEVVVTVDSVGRLAIAKAAPLPAKGGLRYDARYTWQARPPVRLARASGVEPGIYMARATNAEGTYYTPPFQMVADRGALVEMFVYPSLLFQFKGGAEIDDDKMWFPMTLALWNPSVMPLDPGPEGLLIPLPRGFVGAQVADEMQARVRVDADHGFVWKGVFPPGQRSFQSSFGLPIDGGTLSFSMPLPYGSYESHLAFEDTPGMQLSVPASAVRESVEGRGGKNFIILKQISIRPGTSLELTLEGLPQAPSWKKSLPLVAGVAVLSLLLWGVAAIFFFGGGIGQRGARLHPGSREFLHKKRETLLARLVVVDEKIAKKGSAADKGKKLRAERAEIAGELATVYERLGE